MYNSMVSGRDLKSAIEELIDLMMKKSVNDFSLLISKFKDLYLTFSDALSYPQKLKEILKQGIEDAKNESEITVLQRKLYHKCLVSLHNQLAMI